jgi:hypothetical protein
VKDARNVCPTKRNNSFNPTAIIGEELNLDVKGHHQNKPNV